MEQVNDSSFQAGTRPSPTKSDSWKPAFEEFYRLSYENLLQIAVFLGGNEDTVHDAMEQVFHHWPEIQQPLAYTRKIMVRLLMKSREREGRRNLLHRLALYTSHETSGPMTVWEDQEWVQQVLISLPPAQREVMALIVDGWRPAEIAVLLGRDQAAIRQRLLQARKTLKRIMVRANDDANPVVVQAEPEKGKP